jgi:hypothetical protein
MSRMSSLSNLRALSSNDTPRTANGHAKDFEREVFKWTQLRNISHHIYSDKAQKASAVLGTSLGSPTVLGANGLICVGTDEGFVVVYDFKQTLKCICGNDAEGVHSAVFVASWD